MMKKPHFFVLFFSMVMICIGSCGRVVLTSSPGNPPPPWFYPNRVEELRYVYFPEYSLYYDFSERVYLYNDGGIWVRHRLLPPAYRDIDFGRSRYVRIRDYYDDNIERYHQRYSTNQGRDNRTPIRTNRGRSNINN